jgi:hypothetical protein
MPHFNMESSPFSRAIIAHLNEPTKKKRPSFVAECVERKAVITAEEVHEVLAKLEADSSHKAARKILRPVFETLLVYDGVLSTLCMSMLRDSRKIQKPARDRILTTI